MLEQIERLHECSKKIDYKKASNTEQMNRVQKFLIKIWK